MPVDLQIEFDKAKYDDILKRLSLLEDETVINKAISKAAKKAADEAGKETLNLISAQYTIPESELKESIKSRRLGGGEKGAVMQITSGVLPLYKFGGVLPREIMPPAKGPVRAAVKSGGGAELSHAFIAKMPKTDHVGVYEREEEARLDKVSRKGKKNISHVHINELFGPSVPGMFGREKDTEINKAVVEKAGEILNERLIVELERLLNG